MNALTLNDRWKMFCMKFLLGAKKRCCRSNSIILKGVAYTLNLEIRDLDKRYFKKRLNQICIDNSILRLASGSGTGTGKGQQLFYYTFLLLTHSDMLEKIRASDFPHDMYHLLRGSEPKGSDRTKSDLWQIQGTNYGEFQDCYLVRTLNTRGEDLSILVLMPELDKRVGGRSLEPGDCIRISIDPVGPLRYEVLDTVDVTEMWPEVAELLEEPGMTEGLREFLSPTKAAQ
jgi:hypothetical protein